jgi:hypothetical protein
MAVAGFVDLFCDVWTPQKSERTSLFSIGEFH